MATAEFRDTAVAELVVGVVTQDTADIRGSQELVVGQGLVVSQAIVVIVVHQVLAVQAVGQVIAVTQVYQVIAEAVLADGVGTAVIAV